ncbi:glycosyltransferase family 2 protein [Cyanobacterium sp. IPPAS B-1200]|uniref:glycosyltransferase family 2 protein n=1 Tax=Cyanobacterium sp. IPPAS B-1200 TaxID=1562720 RepID=UPI0008526799|nr:glycosyltransferase [Cyanobacterium sp. IPPAS B-1200]OEJ79330.1 glycosyl transferase family A [Cyanobacterium sp. IPPAS B-1200]
MPLISVIIPVYNGEKTIQETIKSVLQQTFTDFELIIINDGSTDNTLEKIAQIEDDRVKVLSFANQGVSAARNLGIANSQGDYLAFLDTDDLWTEDKLELQLKALQENKEAVLAYSWINNIDKNSKFLRSYSHILLNGYVYEKLLISNFLGTASNPLIRRKVFAEIGNFEESFPYAEDWDLYLRIAKKYDFVCVPLPQILYRISSNSLSTNTTKMEKYGLLVIEKNFADISPSLKSLKKSTLSDFYMYLSLKSVEGIPSFKKSLNGLRYFYFLLQKDPLVIKTRKSLSSILLFKILVGLFLPSSLAQKLLNFAKKKSNS